MAYEIFNRTLISSTICTICTICTISKHHQNFPNPKLDFIMKEKGRFCCKDWRNCTTVFQYLASLAMFFGRLYLTTFDCVRSKLCSQLRVLLDILNLRLNFICFAVFWCFSILHSSIQNIGDRIKINRPEHQLGLTKAQKVFETMCLFWRDFVKAETSDL